MIRAVETVGTVAAITLAAFLFMPITASGFGAHHSHVGSLKFFGKSPFAHRRHGHGSYGGLIAGYPIGDYGEPMSQTTAAIRIDPVIPPPPALTCSRSRDTLTVPSEEGGTRQITITRC